MAETLASLVKNGEPIETDTFSFLTDAGNYIICTKKGRICEFFINSGIQSPPSTQTVIATLPAKYRPLSSLVSCICTSYLAPIPAQVGIKSDGTVLVNTSNLGYGFWGTVTYITAE